MSVNHLSGGLLAVAPVSSPPCKKWVGSIEFPICTLEIKKNIHERRNLREELNKGLTPHYLDYLSAEDDDDGVIKCKYGMWPNKLW